MSRSNEDNSIICKESVQRENEAPAEFFHEPPNEDLQTSQLPLKSPAVKFSNRPAHGVYISPTNPTIVFVTVCCHQRRPWLATDKHHRLLHDIWQDSSHWVVGRYVLMPDHLHLFAAPQQEAVAFDAWVKYWKSQFTKRNRNAMCVWQTDHWDTRIRSLIHYEERAQYMFDNPIRANLAQAANAWPYKGEVYELRWD
jgi:putative transposase